MTGRVNHLGQPIGHALPEWSPPSRPSREPMTGRYCRVEAIDPARHGADLHAANKADREDRIWTYLPYGPMATLEDYQAWMDLNAGATIRCSTPSSTTPTARRSAWPAI